MNHSLPLMLPAEPKRQGSVQIPWRIQDDHKRIDIWLYCLGVRERWDQWEDEMVRAGLIEDTRRSM